MRKLIALIIFVLIFSGSLYSQSSWEKKIIDSTLNFTKVTFLNNQTGYISGFPILSGNLAYVYKTTNSGDNWFSVYQSTRLSNILLFISPDFGFITALSIGPPITTGLYRTLDGGVTWQLIYGTTSIYNLYFNNYFGFYSSEYGAFCKSYNNGVYWQGIPITSNFVKKVLFVDYFRGYYLSSDNYIFKSSNSGLNWHQVSAINYIVSDMYFLDSLNGYLSGKSGTNTGGILKTTNGGLNWNFVFNSTEPLKKVSFPTITVGYALGDSIRVFRTSNSGNNWSEQKLDSAYRYNDLSFGNAYTGFVVGQRGIVMRTTNGGSTFINPISTDTPLSYSLGQNYPNPFNPSTVIRFQLSVVSDVKMKVYDIQGREVQTLVNQRLQPGTYEIKFDGSALNSGVYFYRLITNDFTETKKMLMIK